MQFDRALNPPNSYPPLTDEVLCSLGGDRGTDHQLLICKKIGGRKVALKGKAPCAIGKMKAGRCREPARTAQGRTRLLAGWGMARAKCGGRK